MSQWGCLKEVAYVVSSGSCQLSLWKVVRYMIRKWKVFLVFLNLFPPSSFSNMINHHFHSSHRELILHLSFQHQLPFLLDEEAKHFTQLSKSCTSCSHVAKTTLSYLVIKLLCGLYQGRDNSEVASPKNQVMIIWSKVS